MSPPAAAEAAPAFAIWRDDERRSLLGVERTEALVGGPGSLEDDGLPHHVHHRKLRLDLGSDAGSGHTDEPPCGMRRVVKGLSRGMTIFYHEVKDFLSTRAFGVKVAPRE